MSTNRNLFGTDGIRGIAGRFPLEKSLIRKLGAAAAEVYAKQTHQKKPLFIMGRDTRASGPWIAQAFAQGAALHGAKVIDIGVVSTPSIAYLVPKLKATGGVMISASHNPAEFNGIKLFGPTGRKCADAWELAMESAIETHPEVPAKVVTVSKKPAAIRQYLAFLKSTVPPRFSLKGMTLVVDCSNGSLSAIAPAFLKSLGARIVTIGASPNGRNINAGVGSQHPEKLMQKIRRVKADGGIAFDGDADRIMLCDEKGRLLDGDYILACAARILKDEKKLRGNQVVVTVMANLGLIKALESWKIKVEATPVGDRFVSECLDRKNGVIGGEQSGHIIFHDHLPTGDGLLTGLQILRMLRHRDQPLSWVHTLMRKFPQVLVNVHVKEKKPVDQCAALHQSIQEATKVLGNEGRVVIRYSGTEPLLRIMMEGPELNQLKALSEAIARRAREALGAA